MSPCSISKEHEKHKEKKKNRKEPLGLEKEFSLLFAKL
jgi:hypothetical protein